MKRILICLLMLAVVAPVYAGDVTPLYDGSSVTQTLEGAWTFSNVQSATYSNGEKVQNDTDGEVTTVFDDDAAVLGLERTESSNAASNMAAGDEFRKEWGANNDVTQMVTISRIVVDFTDETDGTEDGTHEIWVQVAGTLTKICSVDASGVTVVGDVSGTTIGGITEANLVDKSADETVAGDWTFSNSVEAGTLTDGTASITGGAASGFTTFTGSGLVKGGTLGIGSGYLQRDGDALNWVEGGATNQLDADVTTP